MLSPEQIATRWVGIDEAGYGPNLGPMVMTAVIAEGPEPDLWADLPHTVARAGGAPGRLWVDDSKRILRAGRGRDRLEAACLATLAAAGIEVPGSCGELLAALGAGTLAEAELTHWLDSDDGPFPGVATHAHIEKTRAFHALAGARWRIAGVRSVLVAPERFNAGLAVSGSKASVHFAAFAELMDHVWKLASDGRTTHVRGDKHGGRHFYHDLLLGAFPGIGIDRGPEGPALSQYVLRRDGRRLELSLLPRADAADGLVALASIVSKTVREVWMDVFNAYWTARVPGLKPTAGYPSDAIRFRHAIQGECLSQGLEPRQWWREK